MILKKFYTTKYDNDILFVNPDLTFGDFKKYVYGQTNKFKKIPEGNIVLFGENYFHFAVNFFASVFAGKNIYLLTDKTRLNQLDAVFFLPDTAEPSNGLIDTKINSKNVRINFFTSGSAGFPKRIEKTLYNLELEAQCTLDEFNPEGVVVSTTSSAHSFGLAFNFVLAFCGGLKINQKKIEFPEQFDLNEDYILISTPSFMGKLAKYNFVFDNNPKKIFLAGSKLKPEILEYYNKYSDVIDIYGSTETGNIAYKRTNGPFTVFKDVSILTNSKSEIVVMSEFFPSKKVILSDIIECISDKEFILKNRSDRLVKIQEKRISLDEIEAKIKNFNGVKDCCCFVYNENFSAAVATDNVNLNPKEIKRYLASYSEILPKKWRILDEIPKTENGKIDKTKLNRIFGMNLSMPFVLNRKITADCAEIKIIFKKNCNFFNGHFDIMPVLPGVVQLYFAQYFIEDVFRIKLHTEEVKKVKFSNVIKPDTEIELKLKNQEKFIEFTYMTDNKKFSSGIFIK